ncbi:hypothetical protein KM043_018374 [Ampulex compressa]|nr:hypothetical protein KM043_018374 [Ampulex compressa]
MSLRVVIEGVAPQRSGQTARVKVKQIEASASKDAAPREATRVRIRNASWTRHKETNRSTLSSFPRLQIVACRTKYPRLFQTVVNSLVLLLLAPAIFAQRYKETNDPNNEPFLPIYPVYPYSPKLMKRGTDMVTHLTPELYAPKVDARESYSTSYTTSYPRDSYYPNYNPYPKTSSTTPYSGTTYYSTTPYTYTPSPFSMYNSYSSPFSVTPAPYPGSHYTTAPYSSGSYPPMYYHPPYFYPYYNQPLFPPPPPPSSDYSSSAKDSYRDHDSREEEKKPPKKQKSKDNEYNKDSSQYMDDGNYISPGSKDLDGQPSTYKAASPYNQVEQVPEVQLKNLPIPLPKTTYRVVSVAGQPVGPDYPLPAPYAKAQQLEQLMRHTLVRLLAQEPRLMQYPPYGLNGNAKQEDASYAAQGNYKEVQPYGQVPNIAKTGLAYLVSGNLGKLGGQLPAPLMKNAKYPPLAQVGMEENQGIYMPPEQREMAQNTAQTNDYEGYQAVNPQMGKNYEVPLGQGEDKQGENYDGEQRSAVSYQNQNFVTMQTPQAYSYQYAGYNAPQASTQQTQQYKTNLEDVNFGAKQTNKG